MKPLEALEAESIRHGHVAICRSPEELALHLQVRSADSKLAQYKLIVTAEAGRLQVREEPEHRQLPSYCPNRHIIADGYFCMYWEEHQRYDIIDAQTASVWLTILERFLRMQQRATYLGRWPSKEAGLTGTWLLDTSGGQRRSRFS